MLSSTDTSPQEQQTQQQDHQIRIKHRSMKGQTYRLKLFNRQIAVPFDRLWLLTVFDRYIITWRHRRISMILLLLEIDRLVNVFSVLSWLFLCQLLVFKC